MPLYNCQNEGGYDITLNAISRKPKIVHWFHIAQLTHNYKCNEIEKQIS